MLLRLGKKITPLLDKIVAFEENIKTLPEDVLHKFKEKLLYDECIDLIIESGTESSPDLDAEIDNRISQAFRIVGEQELKEQSEEQDISSPQISI